MSDIQKLNKVKKILSNLSSNGLLTEIEESDVNYILDIVEHPDQTPITRMTFKDSKALCKNCRYEITDPNAKYCPNCGQRLHRVAIEAAYIAYFISKNPHGDEDKSVCQFCSLSEHGCDASMFKEDEWTVRYPICHVDGILEEYMLEDKLIESRDYKKFCEEYFGGKQ